MDDLNETDGGGGGFNWGQTLGNIFNRGVDAGAQYLAPNKPAARPAAAAAAPAAPAPSGIQPWMYLAGAGVLLVAFLTVFLSKAK